MGTVFVVVVVVLIGFAAYSDWRTRRRGGRVRRGGDLGAEIRQQRLQNRPREAGMFRKTGDDNDGTYSPDRDKRLGT